MEEGQLETRRAFLFSGVTELPTLMMIKKSLIRIAASVALSISGASGKPPNVVIFLADDQGWGDLSAHGNTDLNTPNIDSLAKDGASFDRFFVCAVCVRGGGQSLQLCVACWSAIYII